MPSLTMRRQVAVLIALATASSAQVRLVRRNARIRVACVVGSSLRHRNRIFQRHMVILQEIQPRVDAEIAKRSPPGRAIVTIIVAIPYLTSEMGDLRNAAVT